MSTNYVSGPDERRQCLHSTLSKAIIAYLDLVSPAWKNVYSASLHKLPKPKKNRTTSIKCKCNKALSMFFENFCLLLKKNLLWVLVLLMVVLWNLSSFWMVKWMLDPWRLKIDWKLCLLEHCIVYQLNTQ